jgi:ribonuclease P protein subunit RPR2
MAQSHLRARIAYLTDATTFLQSTRTAQLQTTPNDELQHPETTAASHLARQLAAQTRAVSMKAQLRLPRETKRALCKRCDTLLVPETTCTEFVENKSRGGKKPCADVFVVKCRTCGTAKRFPQGHKRSMKLVERQTMQKDTAMSDVQAEPS